MARRPDSRQLGLFDPEPEPSRETSTAPAAPRTEREWIVEQITRDLRVANGPEEYWEPSRQFYLDRAESYKKFLVDNQ
jgi:hypothetical protein